MKNLEKIAAEKYPSMDYAQIAFLEGINYMRTKTDNAFCKGVCNKPICPGCMSCQKLENFRKSLNGLD